MRQVARGDGLRRRMLFSVVPAVLGCVLGYLYARFTLNEATFQALVAWYGAAGAAIGILAVRLFSIFRSILGDYFGSKDE